MNKVFNFHGVSNASWFEGLLITLKSNYTMISIDELLNSYTKNKKNANSCHITFDDGHISFYEIIYPILKKHEIPSTLFVSPHICRERTNFWFQEIKGYNAIEIKKITCNFLNIKLALLDQYPVATILKCLKIDEIWSIIEMYKKKFDVAAKEPCNIDLAQLKEIDSYGLVKIGAHTLNHPILANESDERCNSEIAESINGLKEILGHEIKYFAYPNGYPGIDFGSREIHILELNNCEIAFSCEPGSFNAKKDPLSINRMGFSHNSSSLSIRIKLSMGEYWDRLRDLSTKGEIKSRIEIGSKILKRTNH